jgi:hypothetical protein
VTNDDDVRAGYRVVLHKDGTWHHEWLDEDGSWLGPRPIAQKQAALLNLLFQDVAAIAGMGGAALSLAAAAPVAIAATGLLFVGSAAWFVANRFQAFANDPPRHDFDVVSICEERDTVPMPSELARGVWHDFTIPCVQLATSMRCLTTSIERAEGIVAAIATDAGNSLTDASQRQHDAIQRNALSSIDLIETLLEQRAPMNASWATVRLQLADAAGTSQPEGDPFGKMWEYVEPWIVKSWQLESSELAEMKQQLRNADPPSGREREILLEDGWAKGMQDLAGSLQRLADPSLPFEVIASSSA